MDANSVERAIYSIALNRKNSLLAGHDEGAVDWICLASLIETAKLHRPGPAGLRFAERRGAPTWTVNAGKRLFELRKQCRLIKGVIGLVREIQVNAAPSSISERSRVSGRWATIIVRILRRAGS